MYSKSFIHYVAKVMVDVLLYLAVVAVITLPFAVKQLYLWIGYSDTSYVGIFAAVLTTSGIGCVYILYHLKMMYKSLLVGNPFIDRNVKHLRKIALACFIIALIYFIKCILLFTFASLIIAFVFMVGCLFCLTLKDLFKQAINFKTENELTI